MKDYCVQNFVKSNSFYNCNNAFSIAEMLVTIAIIGMVAMLLMPRLIEGYQQMTSITALKRAYAVSSGAFGMAVINNGSPDTWNMGSQGDTTGLDNLNEVMAENLKLTKNCGTSPGCFPDIKYRDLHGVQNINILNQDPSYTKMMLADGLSLSLKSWDPNCQLNWGDSQALSNVCGLMGIDINGFDAPNKYGVDYFGFVITKYGIIPMGSPLQKSYPFESFCNKDSVDLDVAANGLSCTAWVLYNDNMDYENKSNLSWLAEAGQTDTGTCNNGYNANCDNGNNNTNGNNNNGQTDYNSGNNNTNGNDNSVGANYNDHTNSGNNLTNGNTNGNHTTNGNSNKS